MTFTEFFSGNSDWPLFKLYPSLLHSLSRTIMYLCMHMAHFQNKCCKGDKREASTELLPMDAIKHPHQGLWPERFS